jgi:hypothetical protein
LDCAQLCIPSVKRHWLGLRSDKQSADPSPPCCSRIAFVHNNLRLLIPDLWGPWALPHQIYVRFVCFSLAKSLSHTVLSGGNSMTSGARRSTSAEATAASQNTAAWTIGRGRRRPLFHKRTSAAL